jgi:serine phosphatase RsbU (regulator of sigma subunit)
MAAQNKLSMAAHGVPLLTLGVAAVALPGEVESGDLHAVTSTDTGVLVAVVDGLGHGVDAAVAARAAAQTCERHASEPLLSVMRRCHENLVGTRGAVMSLAFFDRARRTMAWVGVGNVAGVLFHVPSDGRPPRSTLIAPGGIVGREVPALRVETLPVVTGDVLVLASDGVATGFMERPPADASPQQIAEDILARFGKGTDDALVVVARFEGAAGESP